MACGDRYVFGGGHLSCILWQSRPRGKLSVGLMKVWPGLACLISTGWGGGGGVHTHAGGAAQAARRRREGMNTHSPDCRGHAVA